jgi:hypothetical protein
VVLSSGEVGGGDDPRRWKERLWESETLGTFYVHWDPPVLYEIETDEGLSLKDLMQELGRMELQALGRVKHDDVPPAHEGAS